MKVNTTINNDTTVNTVTINNEITTKKNFIEFIKYRRYLIRNNLIGHMDDLFDQKITTARREINERTPQKREINRREINKRKYI